MNPWKLVFWNSFDGSSCCQTHWNSSANFQRVWEYQNIIWTVRKSWKTVYQASYISAKIIENVHLNYNRIFVLKHSCNNLNFHLLILENFDPQRRVECLPIFKMCLHHISSETWTHPRQQWTHHKKTRSYLTVLKKLANSKEVLIAQL